MFALKRLDPGRQNNRNNLPSNAILYSNPTTHRFYDFFLKETLIQLNTIKTAVLLYTTL